VARDPEESGLDTSAFSKSKGARRNCEAASCDGSHGDGAEDSMWHHTSVFRVLKGEKIASFHPPISR
jgi:hypothetical protein